MKQKPKNIPKSSRMQDSLYQYYRQIPGLDTYVVLEPFVMLPAQSGVFYGFDRPGLTDSFYRTCKDREQGLSRQSIDFSQIIFCDYKLYNLSALFPQLPAETIDLAQKSLRAKLDSWLAQPLVSGKPLKFLHISLDHYKQDPRDLLAMVNDLSWQGKLVIELYDRSEFPLAVEDIRGFADLFNKTDLEALDYHRHPPAHTADTDFFMMDLLSETVQKHPY